VGEIERCRGRVVERERYRLERESERERLGEREREIKQNFKGFFLLN